MTSAADAPRTADRNDFVDVVVGRVGKAHGLRGEVVVDVRTDEPARRFAVGNQFTTLAGQLTVRATHWHGNRLLAQFDGFADRSTAEELRGVELHLDVPAHERPDDPEEFYDHQLVGLSVEGPDGDAVGLIAEVLHLPGQDLLVVRRDDGSDVSVPFVRELVPVVDVEARRVVLGDNSPHLFVEAGMGPDDPSSTIAAAELQGDSTT